MQHVECDATPVTPSKVPPSDCVVRMECGVVGMLSVSVSLCRIFVNEKKFLTLIVNCYDLVPPLREPQCWTSISGIVVSISALHLCQYPSPVKSCPVLRAPNNGTMVCSHDRPTMDTECHFACDSGFQLVGSKLRTCLPVAMWDGIPAYCKCKAYKLC